MNSAAAEAEESLDALQKTLARKDHEHSEALKRANDELTSLKRFLRERVLIEHQEAQVDFEDPRI